jgi:hypothetical protein
MERKNKKICTNCQIHEEKNPKNNTPNNNDFIQVPLSQTSGRDSLTSFRTNSELNKAEMRLPNVKKEFPKSNMLERISEEIGQSNTLTQNKNMGLSTSEIKRSSFYSTRPQKANFAKSDVRFNKFTFGKNLRLDNVNSLRTGPSTRLRHSVISNNTVSDNLVQETIMSDDRSLDLMNEINQKYLEQIKLTLDEIKNSSELSHVQKFQMMKEIMAEYKRLVNKDSAPPEFYQN